VSLTRASEQRAASMKRDIASRSSEDEAARPVGTSGWRVIGLYALYVLLSALAAALSAAIGTLPCRLDSERDCR
jgi:hypothetical protein